MSLAEKIDILTGFWAIDEKPTGSKDPFALRRAALGVIRMVLENGLRLRLGALIEAAQSALMAQGVGEIDAAARADLLAFFADRLKVHLKAEGIRHDVIDACFGLGARDDFALLAARAHALQAFVASEDGANLLQGYKRAANILAAEEKKDGVEYSLDPQSNLVEAGAEADLFTALDAAAASIDAALGAEDFAAAMTAMAGLRAPIDRFFTDIVVNADLAIVRRNRLCLLNRIRALVHRVADFSALEG